MKLPSKPGDWKWASHRSFLAIAKHLLEPDGADITGGDQRLVAVDWHQVLYAEIEFNHPH